MYALTVEGLREAYRDYLRDQQERPVSIIFCGFLADGSIAGIFSETLKNSKSINIDLIESLKGNFECEGEYITFNHGVDPVYTHTGSTL